MNPKKKTMSISRKLKIWFFVTTTTLLLALSVFFVVFEFIGLQNRGKEELKALSAVLGHNSTAALIFEDKEAADEILSALINQQKIDGAYIFDAEGKLFASYQKPKASQVIDYERHSLNYVRSKINRHGNFIDEHGLHQLTPISLNGDKIGTIYAIDNLGYITKSIQALCIVVAGLVLALMLASYVISTRLQRRLTDPIVKLKSVMEQVSKDNQYDIELTFDSRDEIGELYHNFNQMLREINERDAALIKHNEHLEEEVQKRTEEIHIANEKLGEYIAKANQARVDAEQLAEAKSLFLANMSHEIRTPLNGVIGIIDILNKTELDEKQQEFVNIARTSSSTLLSIINDVLDFSKIDSSQLELESRKIDIRSIIESVAVQCATTANQKGIDLHCHMLATVERFFFGDELRIKQVLFNLISNAVKFTHSGEVIVTLSKIEKTDPECSRIHLEVSDTGVGIHPDNIDKIFSAFTQEDQSTTRKFGGTGLGLNISKKLITLMSGDIKVKSKLGAGTTFKLNFIVKDGTKFDSDDSVKIDWSSIKVLVVDDSEVNARIIASYLSQWGIEHQVEMNPVNVMDILENASKDKPFDLILMDYHMPYMNGVELAQKIYQHEPTSQVNVIILSSIISTVDLAKLDEDNIKGHLSKPVKQLDLLNIMTNTLFDDQCAPKPLMQIDSHLLHKRINRILVAEDYEINQQIIQIMLENLGCHVTIAVNGLDAFEKYKRSKYDLIFMDCQMPILDGFSAAQKIRVFEQHQRKKVPIIALTGNVTDEDKQKCFDAGMDDFVTKPYSETDIVVMLNKWLNQQADMDEKTPTDSKTESQSAMIDEGKFNSLSNMDKSGQFTVKILDMFENSTENKITCVLEALTQGDYEAIKSQTHMLKSSSANIGAEKFASICRMIETHIKQGNHDAVEPLCQELMPVFLESVAQLKQLKGEQSDDER